MSSPPDEPEDIVRYTASLLHEVRPDLDVEIMDSQRIKVQGRRLDLKDFLRIVNSTQDKERERSLVENYLQKFLGSKGLPEEHSFDSIRHRIMPKLMRYNGKDETAQIPYLNGTSIVMHLDFPEGVRPIKMDEVRKWGKTVDDLEDIARDNLFHYTPDIEFRIKFKEGYVESSYEDGYDATRLLLPIHSFLSRIMQGNFYFATPDQDTLWAIPENADRSVINRIKRRYQNRPSPITPELFYVVQDGIVGIPTETKK